MWIGICDDNILHSNKMEEIIIEHCKKFLNLTVDVEVFDSAETLLKEVTKHEATYPILFLDIEMSGMDGIEVAREIRKKDSDMIIIFVTSYDQYTLKSFEVKPFRYLLKPVNDENVTYILSQAIDEAMKNNQYLFYKHQNLQYQIRCDTIIVVLSENGRMIRVETVNKNTSILFYGKIKEIEKSLNPMRFVKVNPGTIINLSYINIISGNEVHLIDGQIFTISRGQKKIVKESYNDFIARKMGMNI